MSKFVLGVDSNGQARQLFTGTLGMPISGLLDPRILTVLLIITMVVCYCIFA